MAQIIQDKDLSNANLPDLSRPVGTMGQSTSQGQQNQMGQSQNQAGSSQTSYTPPQVGFTGQTQQTNQQDTQQRRGTGFTNIQSIIGANQGNQLGSTIQQGATQQAQGVNQDIGNSLNAFRNTVNQNRLDTQANQTAVNQAIANPLASLGGSTQAQQTQDLFNRIRQGQYNGPTQMANADQLQNEAMQAQQLGTQAGTEAGRLGLLQRFVGGNQYTQGQQTLDNLLLGATGQNNLNAVRSATQGLGQQVGQAQNTAQQLGTQAQQGAQQFSQNVGQQLSQATQSALTPAQQAFAAAQAQDQQNQSQYQQLQAMATATGPTDEDPQTRALIGQLQSMNLINGDQAANLQNQLVQNRGLYSYNTTDQSLLAPALQYQQAQNLNLQSIATPEQRAQVNALQQLAGKTQQFGPDQSIGQYQAGQTTFNYGGLEQSIQDAQNKETQARAAQAAAQSRARASGTGHITALDAALLVGGAAPVAMYGQQTGQF